MKVYSDSKLVVGQVRGELEARDPRMQKYLSQVRSIQTKFEVFDVSHVPRGGNTHADSLATLAMSSAQDLPRVILVEDLYTLTSLHKDMPRIHQINLGPSWMNPISLYLERDILPEEKSKAKKVQRKEIGQCKGKVDRRITTCPLDISNNTTEINMRDPFLNDVWG